jgi:hypothetical protein
MFNFEFKFNLHSDLIDRLTNRLIDEFWGEIWFAVEKVMFLEYKIVKSQNCHVSNIMNEISKLDHRYFPRSNRDNWIYLYTD